MPNSLKGCWRSALSLSSKRSLYGHQQRPELLLGELIRCGGQSMIHAGRPPWHQSICSVAERGGTEVLKSTRDSDIADPGRVCQRAGVVVMTSCSHPL